MPDGNQNSKISLSRRKILAGTGAIGASGLAAGLGSQALFSDQEQFGNNQLVAGELDMKVGYEEHYFRGQDEAMEHAHMEDGDLVIDDHEGFMDATLVEHWPDWPSPPSPINVEDTPCEVLDDPEDRPIIELDDVKPGDFGEITFNFALCDNPGYVWLNGSMIENNENGITEPEADAPGEDDEPGDDNTTGELPDAIEITIWHDHDCNNLRDDSGEEKIFSGSLREGLDLLADDVGLPIDSPSVETCFDPETRHCIGFRWELPSDHGNSVQSDSVKFDLGFYTEQCRNNESSDEALRDLRDKTESLFLAAVRNEDTDDLSNNLEQTLTAYRQNDQITDWHATQVNATLGNIEDWVEGEVVDKVRKAAEWFYKYSSDFSWGKWFKFLRRFSKVVGKHGDALYWIFQNAQNVASAYAYCDQLRKNGDLKDMYSNYWDCVEKRLQEEMGLDEDELPALDAIKDVIGLDIFDDLLGEMAEQLLDWYSSGD